MSDLVQGRRNQRLQPRLDLEAPTEIVFLTFYGLNTREKRTQIKECDINLDGKLDHEEFVKFMQQPTKDTFITVSQGLIITLAVAPTVGLATCFIFIALLVACVGRKLFGPSFCLSEMEIWNDIYIYIYIYMGNSTVSFRKPFS
ncbi:hypothetical protein ACH5RR_000565 [Cinchona calisaya]|uniref:EF-hand domain-containing protein n=1 Tax=Cinchona calisaya TaxID=153742 RepID=A0ABD3B224_9GENT